jgi:hypothetical protein
MSSVDLWTAIGLFFLYIVVDVMYAFYTLAVTYINAPIVAERHGLRSVTASV